MDRQLSGHRQGFLRSVQLRSMTTAKIRVQRKTETLRPAGFIAKIEISSPYGTTQRSDPQIFDTKEQAQARENELAQAWKDESAPADVEIEFD